MIKNRQKIQLYLKQVPSNIKTGKTPLANINLKKIDGVQKGIPLFEGVEINDISFLTQNLETINFFRGCSVGCTHCLKNANTENGLKSVLFEDIERFANGFKELNQRLGLNVLNGLKYLSVMDDSNPSDTIIKGENCSHSITEGMKVIYDALKIPLLYVTSGWNPKSKFAQKSAENLNSMIVTNPQFCDVEISINPFSNIMENSRKALKEFNKEKADYLRKSYIKRMANVLATFLDLFKINKANIIYRHAQDYPGNELVNSTETAKLYQEIYSELISNIGTQAESIPQIKPEIITKTNPSNYIEPSGRARRYFPFNINMEVQKGLINDYSTIKKLSPQNLKEYLTKNAIKCIDINGSVYTTIPAYQTYCVNSPIELIIPTDIKLNYIQKNLKTKNVFSDIEI